jgi:hypothetical protein
MLGLLFAYQRSSLRNASFHQVGLDLQLLMWAQIRDCLEGQVTRKCDADAMLSRRQQQCLPDAIELVNVSGKLIVNENGGTGGRGRYL